MGCCNQQRCCTWNWWVVVVPQIFLESTPWRFHHSSNGFGFLGSPHFFWGGAIIFFCIFQYLLSFLHHKWNMKRKQKTIKAAVSVFFQDASVSHPFYLNYTGPSLKLIWHLKMDGWNTCFLLGWLVFRGYVSFRECNWKSSHSARISILSQSKLGHVRWEFNS